MKSHIVKLWEGKFEVDGKKVDNLKDWNPTNGEQFSIRLLQKDRNERADKR